LVSGPLLKSIQPQHGLFQLVQENLVSLDTPLDQAAQTATSVLVTHLVVKAVSVV